MNKKIILAMVFAFGLIVSPLMSSSTAAEEINTTTVSPDDITSEPVNDADSDNSIMPISETNDNEALTHPEQNPNQVVQTEVEGLCRIGDLGLPCPVACYNDNGEFHEECTQEIDEEGNIFYNGTSGEAEVICASEDEADCPNTSAPDNAETDQEDEETEPAMWPLILSLSALGVTIIFVIIINICGRKK